MDELNEATLKANNVVPMVALNKGFKTIADTLADIQFGFQKLTAEIDEGGNVAFTYTTHGQTYRFEVEE